MYIFLLFLILETERENEETTYITTFANFHSTYELLFFLCWSDIFATQKHFYKKNILVERFTLVICSCISTSYSILFCCTA